VTLRTTAATVRSDDVVAESDGDGEAKLDPFFTRVPELDDKGLPAKYSVALKKSELKTGFGRRTWWLTFTILDEGPHHLKLLIMYVHQIPAGNRISRTSTFWKVYVAATGRMPTRHHRAVNPVEFLRGLAFEATVCTVECDSNQVPLPDGAKYSRIDRLVARITGSPQ
jgi:hypothetical protein